MADYNITAVTRRVVYTGSAGVGPYAFTFPVISQTDIAVYKNSTKLTLTTNYTVTINGATGTGSVTLVVAATGSDRITIIGARAIERTTDFVTAGDLKASSLNEQLDASIILIQQLAEENKRTLKAPQFDAAAVEDGGTVNMVLPASTTRANKVLAFDASGNPSTTITATEVSNAQTYATNAAASATSATASATSATASATSATSSATSATSSASSATSSASSAASSASSATTSASNASTSASGASTSATNAATSASGASTSATNAAASASSASTSASNASSAQTAAESARDATLAAYDSFDDRYLGSKTADPTLDNDGNALVGGALYFNSVAGEMRIWTGSAWVAAYVSGTGFVAKSGDTMTGVLGLTAGTVSLPALTTTGDTNTGIFFPAADTIAFAEGGVEAMRINSSGQVEFKAGTAALPAISTIGDVNTGMLFPAADTVAVSTGGAEAIRINSSGNVGIGETNPTRKLDVAGTAAATYFMMTSNTASAPAVDAAITRPADGTLALVANSTERLRIASAGQIGIGGANYGTSGQVLTSGGSAAAPSWATVSATGQLLRAPQIKTSGTSYTTPAGCTAIYVEAVGGGGGGGTGRGTTNFCAGGGGGGGGYSAKYFTVTAPTSYTYAIGAAGAAAGSGGSTTFTVGATTITGGGGSAGGNQSSTVPGAGGTGGTATNGDFNIVGGGGGGGGGNAGTVVTTPGGNGGTSMFGGGAPGNANSTNGTNGTLYGSGGSGGSSGTSTTGGTGAAGVIRVWEFS